MFIGPVKMSNTYQEQVGRFRVFKQLNDPLRNPEGNWTLFYSTDTARNADQVCNEERIRWAACGDEFKVVDAGEASTITRSTW